MGTALAGGCAGTATRTERARTWHFWCGIFRMAVPGTVPHPPCRVLLFSTMTKLLDLLEVYLRWRQLPEVGKLCHARCSPHEVAPAARGGGLPCHASQSCAPAPEVPPPPCMAGLHGSCLRPGLGSQHLRAPLNRPQTPTLPASSRRPAEPGWRHHGVSAHRRRHQPGGQVGGRRLLFSKPAMCCVTPSTHGADRHAALHTAFLRAYFMPASPPRITPILSPYCRESAIQKFNAKDSEAFIFLLSIRCTAPSHTPTPSVPNFLSMPPAVPLPRGACGPVQCFLCRHAPHASGPLSPWHLVPA